MPKRIILLSDGTGNSSAKVWRTNVWRLFQALDLRASDMVASYDDGVGSSSFKPLAAIGGVFGFGLARNVRDLYKFACRNYSGPDDEIFAFGFSRGAFTIRVVLGLIANQGLVKAESEAELDRLTRAAYRAYRAEKFRTAIGHERWVRALRDWLIAKVNGPYDRDANVPIEQVRLRFVGLWDTVAAYGLPIEEMMLGVSKWLVPLQLPDRELNTRVERACHALSLDDERTTFHPVLWTEAGEDTPAVAADGSFATEDQRISQVWFAGAHSNVGGGYPDDSLAHIPLIWIMDEARACGLKLKENGIDASPLQQFDPDVYLHANSIADKDGRIYDSRSGFGGYYRYGPRRLDQLCNQSFSKNPKDRVLIERPKIHESVFQRIRNHAHGYAPLGLPVDYDLVTNDRRVVPMRGAPAIAVPAEAEPEVAAAPPGNRYETPVQAAARVERTEQVWNDVWRRRVIYFLTVGAGILLVAYPWFVTLRPADELLSPFFFVSDIVRFLGTFLPSIASRWIDAYARSPGFFLGLVIVTLLLLWRGAWLSARINSRMDGIWRSRTGPPPRLAWVDAAIQRLRTNSGYLATLEFLKRKLVPALSAIVLFVLGLGLLSHVLFNVQDAAGLVCPGTPGIETRPINVTTAQGEAQRLQPVLLPGDSFTYTLHTKQPCGPTGLIVERGVSYSVQINRDSEWRDAAPWGAPGIRTGLGGFSALEAGWSAPVMLLATPFRRAVFQPWFRIVARTGATGGAEAFFMPDPDRSAECNDRYLRSAFRPAVKGELFLHVNDAVIGLPGLYGLFYRFNQGTATVTVTRLPATLPEREC